MGLVLVGLVGVKFGGFGFGRFGFVVGGLFEVGFGVGVRACGDADIPACLGDVDASMEAAAAGPPSAI